MINKINKIGTSLSIPLYVHWKCQLVVHSWDMQFWQNLGQNACNIQLDQGTLLLLGQWKVLASQPQQKSSIDLAGHDAYPLRGQGPGSWCPSTSAR